MRLAQCAGRAMRHSLAVQYMRPNVATLHPELSLSVSIRHTPVSFYSSNQGSSGKNFISKFYENVVEEMNRNKELQENKKLLQQRMQELGESDALREARKKFDKVEQETQQNTELIKVKVKEFKDHIDKLVANIQTTETGKKLSLAGQEALKQARMAAEKLEKAAEVVGDTQVYKQVASTAKMVKTELDTITDVRMYSRPEQLKMRSDGFSTSAFSARPVEVNTEATGVELHKEARWYQNWKNFSENNSYLNKLMDWKNRYDESENIAVRFVRAATDRLAHVFTSSSDVSEVLTEIAKIDPSFDKVEWLRFCEKEVIPNILEAIVRGDLKVLEDWCHEKAFGVLSALINEYKKIGFTTKDSRVIDISKVEMASGKMTDQGPVLVITFQVFMTNVVTNSEGKVIQGDPNNPVRVHHVWVMCRDMEEYNPAMAWKLLELHFQEAPLSI